MTSLKNTFSCAPSGTEWLRLPLHHVPGFSPWGCLHFQIILKLLCSPEITSWGEARVTTAQAKTRLSSPLSQFLTPQGKKLLCAIWGTSDYLSIRLCPQNLPGMADVLWKLELPVRELFKCHVAFVYFLHSLFIQPVTSFRQSTVHWRKTHSLILSYRLSWSKPSGVSSKYYVTTVLCATSQPMLISPCAVKVYLAQSLAVTPFYNAYHWYARALYSQQRFIHSSFAAASHCQKAHAPGANTYFTVRQHGEVYFLLVCMTVLAA